MARILSALALAGSPANYLVKKSGTIMVHREDRIPPDIILLVPSIPMAEADELAARIKEGEDYAELKIISDGVERPPTMSQWYCRR